MLNEDKRGATLEAVVSRMKTIRELRQQQRRVEEIKALKEKHRVPLTGDEYQQHMRFVAISATIPNIEDIAVWLGDKEKPARFHKYDFIKF